MPTENYTKTFTTFSGSDIIATFNEKVIGQLQGITYSITREKAPIYTMGSPDPRSFSRGKRGIAGNLVFTVFDRDAILAELGQENNVYGWGQPEEFGTPIHQIGDGFTVDEESGAVKQRPARKPFYVDEIPPFNVTITYNNEYGQMAKMVMYGVEILNEGSGMSIDDVVTERAMTYVCRKIARIRPIGGNGGPAARSTDEIRNDLV